MGRRAAPPVVAAEVAELAGIAAGPQLLARLVAIHEPALTGHESVLYLRAWQRMANYTEGRFVGAVAGVMVRRDPGYGLVDTDDAEAGRRFDAVAAGEVRSALLMSRRRANGVCVSWRRS